MFATLSLAARFPLVLKKCYPFHQRKHRKKKIFMHRNNHNSIHTHMYFEYINNSPYEYSVYLNLCLCLCVQPLAGVWTKIDMIEILNETCYLNVILPPHPPLLQTSRLLQYTIFTVLVSDTFSTNNNCHFVNIERVCCRRTCIISYNSNAERENSYTMTRNHWNFL